jgi:hypothetical protein
MDKEQGKDWKTPTIEISARRLIAFHSSFVTITLSLSEKQRYNKQA